jgi:predicted amidophosphoribosyltransferase
MLRPFVRAVGALAAPPLCAICGGDRAGDPVLCHRCARGLAATAPRIEPGPPGVDLACAAGPYRGVIRALVVGLKFGRRLALAGPAAAALAGACPEGELAGEVVPVPAASVRWRWRGFDPAEELALALSRTARLPYNPCLRRRHGPRQVGRSRRSRLASPPRVALGRPAPTLAVLVDDVHTTGATLGACAAALRAGGCQRLIALTLARS